MKAYELRGKLIEKIQQVVLWSAQRFFGLELRKHNRHFGTASDDILFNSAIENYITPLETNGLPIRKTDTSNEYTVNYLYNPFALLVRGYKAAMCSYDPWCKVVTIFVDDFFMELEPVVQDFIIEHEIGHVVMNHYCMSALGRDINQELEADKYALGVVGKDNACASLASLHCLVKNKKSRKELVERIERLEVI